MCACQPNHTGPAMRDKVARVLSVIGGNRFTLSNEKATQGEIGDALCAAGVAMLREHRLSANDIPDFFCPDTGLVIEVKLKGANKMAVWRQLFRYAEHDQVRALILVTNLAMGVPALAAGKPVFYLSLGAAWL